MDNFHIRKETRNIGDGEDQGNVDEDSENQEGVDEDGENQREVDVKRVTNHGIHDDLRMKENNKENKINGVVNLNGKAHQPRESFNRGIKVRRLEIYSLECS